MNQTTNYAIDMALVFTGVIMAGAGLAFIWDSDPIMAYVIAGLGISLMITGATHGYLLSAGWYKQ